MRVATVLRLLALPAVVVFATVLFDTRIRKEMIDFVTWQQAIVRALHAEPLYPLDAGHYQFKYLPAFALLMAPLGMLNPETAKLFWFAIEVGLIAALLRWSIAALPGPRHAPHVLLGFAIVLMAKFYGHELLLGQTNLLLAVLLVTVLFAVQDNRPLRAGAIVGAAVFVKPYSLVLLPWLIVTQGWRSGITTLGIVSIGLFLPAMVYGWSANLQLLSAWLRTVTDSTAPLLLNSDNVSVAAMWAKWLGPGPPATGLAWATVTGIVVLVTAVLLAKALGAIARIPRVRVVDAPRSPSFAAGLGLRAAAGDAGGRLHRRSLARVDGHLALGPCACARDDGADAVRHHGPHVVQPLHGAVAGQRMRVGDRRRSRAGPPAGTRLADRGER